VVLFLEGDSIEVLLTIFQSFEGKFPMNGAEKFQTQISISAIYELLDDLVNLVDGVVVWLRFTVLLLTI
jgi:hypothetical protein